MPQSKSLRLFLEKITFRDYKWAFMDVKLLSVCVNYQKDSQRFDPKMETI